MPQQINTGGPPPVPPSFRGRGGFKRRNGFWARFGQQSFGFKVQVIGSFLGILLIMGWFVWRFLIPHGAPAQAAPPASEATPTDTPTRQIIQAEAQPQGSDIGTVSTFGSPLPLPQGTLTQDQARATATFQAAISRPAGNPAASPNYIGVITYESGCSVSNLGFTTSGYNGTPFYLYFAGLLDRDPNMQMVQVRGYVQKFDDCQYPVIMVSEVYWLNQGGTPSPLAIGGPSITGTVTITGPNPATWGHGEPRPTSTPTYTVWIPPQKDLPMPATYTPYPTYTPQPADVIYQTVVPLIPTYTPYPTWTPNPATATPTPTATPQAATLYGPVLAVAGCPGINFAINAGGQQYFIVFDGAQLPPGQPTNYLALATGVLDVLCGGQSIKAKSITWYEATATPTPTVTPTPTATLTPTATATLTPTAVITP